MYCWVSRGVGEQGNLRAAANSRSVGGEGQAEAKQLQQKPTICEAKAEAEQRSSCPAIPAHTLPPPLPGSGLLPPETGPHGSARAINFFHGRANQIKGTPRYCAMEGLLKRPGECGPSWADRSTTRPTQTQLNEVQHCQHCNIRGAHNIPDAYVDTTRTPSSCEIFSQNPVMLASPYAEDSCSVPRTIRARLHDCTPAIARLLKRHPFGRLTDKQTDMQGRGVRLPARREIGLCPAEE